MAIMVSISMSISSIQMRNFISCTEKWTKSWFSFTLYQANTYNKQNACQQ